MKCESVAIVIMGIEVSSGTMNDGDEGRTPFIPVGKVLGKDVICPLSKPKAWECFVEKDGAC